MSTANMKTPRTSASASFSMLWVAKLIPLFDGLDLANLGRWTRALDQLACNGRVGDRAALLLFLSDRVIPALAREELPRAMRAWDAAGSDGTAPVAAPAVSESPKSRKKRAMRPVPAVLRAAAEARRLEAPREAFLAALLYDRVARLVSRAAGMLMLSHKACRELIESSLEQAPDLVEAALHLQ